MTRAMLVVPAEKAIYELPEDSSLRRTHSRSCRDVEQRLLGLEQGSFRPVLVFPICSGEAAYYHGYVLAEMGVEQTRQFILNRDGFLTDNPKLDPCVKVIGSLVICMDTTTFAA